MCGSAAVNQPHLHLSSLEPVYEPPRRISEFDTYFLRPMRLVLCIQTMYPPKIHANTNT